MIKRSSISAGVTSVELLLTEDVIEPFHNKENPFRTDAARMRGFDHKMVTPLSQLHNCAIALFDT